VDDFWRHIHAVTVTESALETLGPAVVTLAEAEGLHAHAESVRVRWPG
jgi:histidinol dehydrogenase